MDVEEKRRIATIKSVEMLEENYARLGKPSFDPKSKSFWEFFGILVDMWQIAYPLEVVEWLETRESDLAEEKTLSEQVKQGLHKAYAFPMGFYKLIKGYWPKSDLMSPEFARKFKFKFPMFRNSKYT